MITILLKIITGVLIWLIAASAVMAKDELADLEVLEWKNRVILINNISQVELEDLHSSQQAKPLAERYITWFAIREGQILTNYKGMINENLSIYLLEKYYLDRKQANKRVLLLGYDGYLKLQETSLDLKLIYKTIDGMPMRQMEMQRQ